MKLTLQQLQMLDFLIKKSSNAINNNLNKSSDLKLSLVINYNNSFWSGDFISLNNSYIEELYIDSDDWVEKNYTSSTDLFRKVPNFKLSRFKNISEESLSLLLESLVDIVKSNDLTSLKFKPFLYNAVNLETKLALPFIYLDNECEYEVISIIFTKE